MSVEKNLKYEMFVRRVFGNVDRWGDPLQLANTDINDGAGKSGDLTNLRLGVVYAVTRLRVRLESQWVHTGADYETLDNMIPKLMNSRITYDEIHQMLDAADEIPLRYDKSKAT